MKKESGGLLSNHQTQKRVNDMKKPANRRMDDSQYLNLSNLSRDNSKSNIRIMNKSPSNVGSKNTHNPSKSNLINSYIRELSSGKIKVKMDNSSSKQYLNTSKGNNKISTSPGLNSVKKQKTSVSPINKKQDTCKEYTSGRNTNMNKKITDESRDEIKYIKTSTYVTPVTEQRTNQPPVYKNEIKQPYSSSNYKTESNMNNINDDIESIYTNYKRIKKLTTDTCNKQDYHNYDKYLNSQMSNYDTSYNEKRNLEMKNKNYPSNVSNPMKDNSYNSNSGFDKTFGRGQNYIKAESANDNQMNKTPILTKFNNFTTSQISHNPIIHTEAGRVNTEMYKNALDQSKANSSYKVNNYQNTEYSGNKITFSEIHSHSFTPESGKFKNTNNTSSSNTYDEARILSNKNIESIEELHINIVNILQSSNKIIRIQEIGIEKENIFSTVTRCDERDLF
jgi:hypothetical protein